jgi:hypothetical protein
LTAGSQSFDTSDESLKVTFSTEVVSYKAPYYSADISVFNLNQNTQQALLDTAGNTWGGNDPIQQGNVVQLFAGYQSNFNGAPLPLVFTNAGFQPVAPAPAASSSLIWTGQVYQPMWERVNVTDYKITLHCMVGFLQGVQNFVSFTQGYNSNQVDILRRIAKESTNGIAIDNIADLEAAVGTTQLARGKTTFGRPDEILQQIAQTNNLMFYLSPNGINVRSIAPVSAQATPDLVYGPPWPPTATVQPENPLLYTPTLIGTPQQTQEGVVFRVLMDSRVKLGNTVQLDLSGIKQLPRYPNQYLSVLDQTLTYVVCAVRHVGDTRGDDWYTEITGVSKNFWPIYAQTSAQPNTGTGS